MFPIVVYLCLPSSTDCKDPAEIKVIQYRAGCSVAAHMMEHTHISVKSILVQTYFIRIWFKPQRTNTFFYFIFFTTVHPGILY